MRRRRDEELYGAFDEQEDELSLEAILAEYGKGGRQPCPDGGSGDTGDTGRGKGSRAGIGGSTAI